MTLYRTILMATDFSETSEDAFQEAVRLARDTGAVLRVVHVYQPPTAIALPFASVEIYETLDREAREGAARRLEPWIRRAADRGVTATPLLRRGAGGRRDRRRSRRRTSRSRRSRHARPQRPDTSAARQRGVACGRGRAVPGVDDPSATRRATPRELSGIDRRGGRHESAYMAPRRSDGARLRSRQRRPRGARERGVWGRCLVGALGARLLSARSPRVGSPPCRTRRFSAPACS